MPIPLLSLSRRLRSTPYTPRIEALGVKAYTVYNHMLLATVFRSLEEDYQHLCDHVQLWDVSCERQVELSGPDAARLLQMMTPRDLGRAVVGQCVYAPVVDADGGMINDPVVLKLAEDRYWVSIADSDVLLFAAGLALGGGLDVRVAEPEVYPLAVQGPKADDLMARVFGEAVREIRFFRFARLAFQGHPLVVARSGWSKQGGFEIYLDRLDLALPLWDALWQAGQDLDVGPGCPNLIERVESALLSYGSDMTRENNPFECGLDRYCQLDGPEFLGREALRRVRDAGPARRIRGLRIDGGALPPCRSAWPLSASGGNAGRVTSAVWSPRFDSNLAFAMVERAYWEAGTRLDITLPDGAARHGIVCNLPFAES